MGIVICMMTYIIRCNREVAKGTDSENRFYRAGVMGAPMARNLAAAGHELTVSLNRSGLPEGLAAQVVGTPAEVARASEVVITMLPDTPDVERVLLGAGGVAEGIAQGALVIDMSSISPIATAHFAAVLRENGAGYLTRRSRAARSGPRPPA